MKQVLTCPQNRGHTFPRAVCNPPIMNVRSVAALVLVATTGLGVQPVEAQIDVNPSVHVFEPGGAPETTLIVTNSSAANAFVAVKAREVMARGELDEKLREDTDPETLGLIATPSRIILEKGERRGIRIVALGKPGGEDRVWRVLVSEVAGKVKEGESGVAFLLAYDVLVIQRPAEAQVAVSGKRNGNTLTLSNSGNSFGVITEVRHCPTARDCTKLPDNKRLYGGRSWTVTLPSEAGTVEVVLQGLNARQETLRF